MPPSAFDVSIAGSSRSMCSVDNTRGWRVPNIPMIQ
jgi:hypothetical protein